MERPDVAEPQEKGTMEIVKIGEGILLESAKRKSSSWRERRQIDLPGAAVPVGIWTNESANAFYTSS